MGNLTLETGLVRKQSAPRPEKDRQVVVYKEVDGGKVYWGTLGAGERFRRMVPKNWFGSYIGYSVPSPDQVLHHEIHAQLSTGEGKRHDHFMVDATLVYRVSSERTLADRTEDDPLGELVAQLRRTLEHHASNLTFDQLMAQRADLGTLLLGGNVSGTTSDEPKDLTPLRATAQGNGLGLDRVEITSRYSSGHYLSGQKLVAADRRTDVIIAEHRPEREVVKTKNELDELREHGRRRVQWIGQGSKFSEKMLDRLDQAIGNIVARIGSSGELRTAVAELVAAQRDLAAVLTPPHETQRLQVDRIAEPDGFTGRLALADDSPLQSELRRMFEVVGTLDCKPSQQAVLTGKLLHVLAEASLGSQSENGRLEEHVAELGRYCASIDIAQAMTTEEHHRYLSRFRKPDDLRRLFSNQHGEPDGETDPVEA